MPKGKDKRKEPDKKHEMDKRHEPESRPAPKQTVVVCPHCGGTHVVTG